MLILTTLILAAAAAGGDEGIVAKGSLVVGSGVISALVTWLAAKKHAEKTSVPQPCVTEQTSYQAAMKSNAKDHGDIFDRLRKCEANIATLMERTISQGKILDRMADQVGQLYDRIVMGKRK